MFVGLIIAILIIFGYSMYASNKYALKTDIEELQQRVTKLEEALSQNRRC